jgi:RNAse (barnase) inhibitor barstar
LFDPPGLVDDFLDRLVALGQNVHVEVHQPVELDLQHFPDLEVHLEKVAPTSQKVQEELDQAPKEDSPA